MSHLTMFFFLSAVLSLVLVPLSVRASPFPLFGSAAVDMVLQRRTTQPTFPDSPASCQVCAANYGSIQNCAEAAPVLANFTNIIFNPGAFINVIQCSCTETFQSVFPQCVDCFEQTNQTDVLAAPDLPSVVQGMRQICAIASTLLGSAVLSDGVLPSSTSSAAAAAASSPTTTSSTSSALSNVLSSGEAVGMYYLTTSMMAVLVVAGASQVLY